MIYFIEEKQLTLRNIKLNPLLQLIQFEMLASSTHLLIVRVRVVVVVVVGLLKKKRFKNLHCICFEQIFVL